MPWRVTVTDDRGRSVPLAPTEILPDGGEGERAARLKVAARAPREPTTRAEILRGVVFGLLAGPVMIFVTIAPAWLAISARWPWWATLVACIPMVACPALVTIFVVRRVTPQRLAQHQVRAGYCGSCGHDLTGLAPEADGCRVCSECGAAWR